MKKDKGQFHLKITKGPGEMDLSFGLFRGGKFQFTIRQLDYALNRFDLPVSEDTQAAVLISGIHEINRVDKIWRVHGYAGLYVQQRWLGIHSSYDFLAEYDAQKRTGLARLWRPARA